MSQGNSAVAVIALEFRFFADKRSQAFQATKGRARSHYVQYCGLVLLECLCLFLALKINTTGTVQCTRFLASTVVILLLLE